MRSSLTDGCLLAVDVDLESRGIATVLAMIGTTGADADVGMRCGLGTALFVGWPTLTGIGIRQVAWGSK